MNERNEKSDLVCEGTLKMRFEVRELGRKEGRKERKKEGRKRKRSE